MNVRGQVFLCKKQSEKKGFFPEKSEKLSPERKKILFKFFFPLGEENICFVSSDSFSLISFT